MYIHLKTNLLLSKHKTPRAETTCTVAFLGTMTQTQPNPQSQLDKLNLAELLQVHNPNPETFTFTIQIVPNCKHKGSFTYICT